MDHIRAGRDFATRRCLPSNDKDEEEVIQENEESVEETVMIPDVQLKDEFYQTLLPFKKVQAVVLLSAICTRNMTCRKRKKDCYGFPPKTSTRKLTISKKDNILIGIRLAPGSQEAQLMRRA